LAIKHKILALMHDPKRASKYLCAMLRGDHDVANRIRIDYQTSSISAKVIRIFPDSSREINHAFTELFSSKFHSYMKVKASDDYVRSAAQGLPIHEEGLLYVLARLARPTKIVETGVGPGVSTAYLLKALEDNGCGHLYSIDMPTMDQELQETRPEYRMHPNRKKTRTKQTLRPSGWLVPEYLKNRWTLQVGLSSSLLPPLLAEVGEIDLFVHDSDHTYRNMMFEFTSAWPHLRKGGMLISDDTEWNNAFSDFAIERGQTGIELGRLGAIIK